MANAFDTVRLPISCPACGKNSPEFLRYLVSRQHVDCRYCRSRIDLRHPSIKAAIDRMADLYNGTPTRGGEAA